MRTHEELIKNLLERPSVRAEAERIEREEGASLDAMLKTKQDAGLTQAKATEPEDDRLSDRRQ